MRNKSRSILTTTGIIIGVAAIISLVSISEGILTAAGTTFEGMQYITLMEKGAMDDTLSRIPISEMSRVSRVRGVKYYTPQINFFASSFNGKRLDASSISNDLNIIMVFGIDGSAAKDFENSIPWYKTERGRMLEKGEEKSILINKKLAEEDKLSIGSLVEINNEKFRVIGIIDFEISIGLSYKMAVMDIGKARTLAGYAEDEVGIINVLPEDLTDIDRFISRLKTSLPNLSVFSSQQIGNILSRFFETINTALWFISSIAGVVGGIVVMNTMLMSVMERIKEFGVLKAIGWKNNHIVLMVLSESILIGLTGGVIGVIMGFLGSYAVETFSGIPTFVTPILIIQVMIFAVLVGGISAVYPAIIASKMSPIEAVTYE